MAFQFSTDSGLSKAEQYAQLASQARALLDGESDRIANAANFCALVFNGLADLNWAGFYFFDGVELVVGPFQGLPACVRIPIGQGVCGAAAQTRRLQLIDDVSQFPGHIACDAASRSEIVVPIVVADRLVGVFDADSPLLARFDEQDRIGMQQLVGAFTTSLSPPSGADRSTSPGRNQNR